MSEIRQRREVSFVEVAEAGWEIANKKKASLYNVRPVRLFSFCVFQKSEPSQLRGLRILLHEISSSEPKPVCALRWRITGDIHGALAPRLDT